MLKRLLKEILDKNFLIICMGNEFRGDDEVGIYIYRRLKEYGMKNILNVGNALENFFGVIAGYKPETILFIDGIYAGLKPGEIVFTEVKNIREVSFASTHKIPIKLLIKYLNSLSIYPRSYILGIQISNIGFGGKMSKVVKNSAEKILEIFFSILSSSHRDY